MENYKLPQTKEEFDKRFGNGISDEEKKILTKKELEELNQTGILEGDFVYDENGKPKKFISINDINFSLTKEEIKNLIKNLPELPKSEDEFNKRF